MDSATVQFNANKGGSVSVHATVPAGFSQPAQAANTLTASIATATLIPPSLTVGKNLEVSANVALNGAAPVGGLVITVASNDTSKLLFSNTATGAGLGTINVKVQGGGSVSLDFFAYGLASSGSASYTVSAAGFGMATGTVTLQPSGIVIAGPLGFGNPVFTTNSAAPTTITVSSALLDSGGNFVEVDAVAGGAQVSVGVQSLDTAIGTISTSPVIIPAGAATGTTLFKPAGGTGNTTVVASVPAGFTAPAQYGSVAVQVTVPGISLASCDGVLLGNKLELPCVAVLGQPAPAGGLVLTLKNNDPGVTLSATATAAGQGTITISVPANALTANYFVQGVGSSGVHTYTASAQGYNSRTATVDLTPSGVVLAGPLGVGVSFFNASLAAGGTTPVSAVMAQLDPSTNTYVQTQQLAGGQTVNISFNNSSPGIGTVTSPVTLTGGKDTVNTPFTPLSQGTTVLSVNTPAGFTQSATSTSLTAQVKP